jgi:hypothetical protein
MALATPRAVGLAEIATRAFVDLRSKYVSHISASHSRNEDIRLKSAKQLRAYVRLHFFKLFATPTSCSKVEAEARELSGENFSKIIHALNRKIFELVNSNEPHEKMGGIAAIGALTPFTLTHLPSSPFH